MTTQVLLYLGLRLLIAIIVVFVLTILISISAYIVAIIIWEVPLFHRIVSRYINKSIDNIPNQFYEEGNASNHRGQERRNTQYIKNIIKDYYNFWWRTMVISCVNRWKKLSEIKRCNSSGDNPNSKCPLNFTPNLSLIKIGKPINKCLHIDKSITNDKGESTKTESNQNNKAKNLCHLRKTTLKNAMYSRHN